MNKIYLDKNIGFNGMYIVYDGWVNGRRVNPFGTYNRKMRPVKSFAAGQPNNTPKQKNAKFRNKNVGKMK